MVEALQEQIFLFLLFVLGWGRRGVSSGDVLGFFGVPFFFSSMNKALCLFFTSFF